MEEHIMIKLNTENNKTVEIDGHTFTEIDGMLLSEYEVLYYKLPENQLNSLIVARDVIKANNTSVVQHTLTNNGTVSLNYVTAASYPNISKSNTMIPPVTDFDGSPDGKSHRFDIPRTQRNYNGMLEFKYTKTFVTDDEAVSFNIVNMIKCIQFLSNGQPILTIDGDAYHSVAKTSISSLQSFIERNSKALNNNSNSRSPVVSAGTSNCISYLPLFASWYQEIEKALNTRLCQISVVVTYKSFVEAGLSSPLDLFSAKLECFKYQPDAETDAKILVSDFSEPLLMECFNTIVERKSDLNTGSNMLQSNVRNCVYKTHLYVAKRNVSHITEPYGCPYLPIKSISVNIGGFPYIVQYSKEALDYEQAIRGFDTVRFNSSIITVDWSLGCHRDSNTGVASFAHSDFVFEVDIGDPIFVGDDDIGNYTLFIVHEYWNILQIDQSGSIHIAASW